MAKLRELQARHPVIGEVRGRGLMIGMELVTDRASRAPAKELCDRIVDRAYYNGLLLLACGKSTLRFMPPLSVTQAEVDEAMAILEQTITECSAAPSRAGAQAR